MSAIEDIKTWELLSCIAKTGSLSLAAMQCGVDVSTASRKLAQLEKISRYPLLDRNSRPIIVSEFAKELLSDAKPMIEAYQDLCIKIQCVSVEHKGLIRLMMPATVGELAPCLLDTYRKIFPEVSFSLQIPIVENAFEHDATDVLILTGEPRNTSGLIRIPRGCMYFLPLASPKWIAQYGNIEHPSEIPEHQLMSIPWHPDGITRQLWKNEQSFSINPDILTHCTNARAIKNSVLLGLSAALDLPFFYCVDEIRSGRLVPILNGWHRKSQMNYVVCSAQSWKHAKYRTFAQWIAQQLESTFDERAHLLMEKGIDFAALR